MGRDFTITLSEAHIEMYPTWFLCNNRLAKHGLIVTMMMTMTLDLRLAAIVQDLTVTALDLHMIVDMIVDLHLASGIRGLYAVAYL